MPPDALQPGSPGDWMRHAKSDLALAAQPPVPGVLYETLCFHAQQAVEKSLKAVLAHYGANVPLTHSIAKLITVVRAQRVDWPTDLDDAATLTQYAVQLRYPGPHTEATEQDYREAIDLARRVIEWAECQLCL